MFMRIAILMLLLFFFSSRRRHTRWPRDWSSDVCSSDLETADCRSYRPGHTVHFIQARHAAEHPDPVPVLASVDAAGAILVTDESGGLRLHNHGPARAAAALARSGGRAELVRAKSVLGVPQIGGGAMFSIAVDQRWSPCTLGPGARGARGPTGPGDSGTDAE